MATLAFLTKSSLPRSISRTTRNARTSTWSRTSPSATRSSQRGTRFARKNAKLSARRSSPSMPTKIVPFSSMSSKISWRPLNRLVTRDWSWCFSKMHYRSTLIVQTHCRSMRWLTWSLSSRLVATANWRSLRGWRNTAYRKTARRTRRSEHGI